MADFGRLRTTLAYARLGLVSLTAAIVPIAGTAQQLCGSDLFEGEPDADSLMAQTLEFLDILEIGGVVAFEGVEGRMSIGAARQALQDGVGSASLLACVVDAESIEFAGGEEGVIVGCDAGGAPSILGSSGSSPDPTTGALFCTTEVATIAQYMGSQA
ncbi:hypothetical protein HKCCE3408_14470 [Rhodobacterales bacterium HKCCE3408]|nr:hypothetical protein [Rhodobacterales bacterium HKCCE3408]